MQKRAGFRSSSGELKASGQVRFLRENPHPLIITLACEDSMEIRECKLCIHAKVCMYYDDVIDAVTNVHKSIEDSTEDDVIKDREALKAILLLLGNRCKFYKRG